MKRRYISGNELYAAWSLNQNGTNLVNIATSMGVSTSQLKRLLDDVKKRLSGGRINRKRNKKAVEHCLEKIISIKHKSLDPSVVELPGPQTEMSVGPIGQNPMSPYAKLEMAEEMRTQAIIEIIDLEVAKKVKHITEAAKQSNLVGTLQKHFSGTT